jgi:hypothetical protein
MPRGLLDGEDQVGCRVGEADGVGVVHDHAGRQIEGRPRWRIRGGIDSDWPTGPSELAYSCGFSHRAMGSLKALGLTHHPCSGGLPGLRPLAVTGCAAAAFPMPGTRVRRRPNRSG